MAEQPISILRFSIISDVLLLLRKWKNTSNGILKRYLLCKIGSGTPEVQELYTLSVRSFNIPSKNLDFC